ncbi:TetR/AcrR family transcriptional regulator [Sporichthya sp.]|uniref:TetR/AcrR family transcriptional regulator n=1 Tax=Sporichthya sp. TaxID=65475 RepID=UPI0017AEB925|nr:TetR/AcrR family transcriptional regulator [Sporichthya sp.]MBA3744098.1 TetR/AcrR family transcriptional regulator [Sporichthya sp.]
MSTVTAEKSSAERGGTARERLLKAADELFYAEGINTVGIDRVIEHAGVAKASLYSSFGSKDGLIRAYLERRHELRVARIERHRAQHVEPKARMLAVYDSFDELINSPAWRGCPFIAATGEARTDATVNEVAAVTRDYTRQCFLDEATALGIADPAALADQLVLLYNGAVVAAGYVDRSAAVRARAIAELVIDSAPR